MSLLFAAIGATVMALVEVTLAPRFQVGDAVPHPVLVGGVIWTIAAGIDRGIAWAFVGGLLLDSLLARPLGVSAFALLVAAGGAALLAQPFPRLRLVAPVVAVPIFSYITSFLIMALSAASRPGTSIPNPIGLLAPGVLYDALLGMFIGPIVVMLHDRRVTTERVDW
jgi:rod shape-determining protein MreD